MRVKVLRTFKDKYTDTLNKINTEIEVTEKRFKEINSTRLGVFVEAINKNTANKAGTSKK